MSNPPIAGTQPALIILSSAVAIAVAVAALATTPAGSRPIYARQTGMTCAQCHIDPQGGGPRTALGRAFAANGHHLPGTRREFRHGVRRDDGPGMGHHGHGAHMMAHDGYGGMMGHEGYGGHMMGHDGYEGMMGGHGYGGMMGQ